jgi:hypothetical protein
MVAKVAKVYTVKGKTGAKKEKGRKKKKQI